MYSSDPLRVEAWWHALSARLTSAGIRDVPRMLSWPEDYHAQWHDPALLLSQACGFPLMTELRDRVRVVGGFHYGVDGADGLLCRSALVTRSTEHSHHLAGFRGLTVAYNATNSQSGYNSLRAMVAPLARGGVFFGNHLETGSHKKAAEAVRDGLADIAAIDCVTLAGFLRYAPQVMHGLRVMEYSEPYPGLPLITSATTSDATLATLRAVLAAAMHEPALNKLRKDLFIEAFEPLESSAYQVCIDMRDRAIALGCPTL